MQTYLFLAKYLLLILVLKVLEDLCIVFGNYVKYEGKSPKNPEKMGGNFYIIGSPEPSAQLTLHTEIIDLLKVSLSVTYYFVCIHLYANNSLFTWDV